jgi:hypothetical protein
MNTGRKLILEQAVQSRTRNGLRDLLSLGHVGRWWTEQLSCKLMMLIIILVIVQCPAYHFITQFILMFNVHVYFLSSRPVPFMSVSRYQIQSLRRTFLRAWSVQPPPRSDLSNFLFLLSPIPHDNPILYQQSHFKPTSTFNLLPFN